MKLPFTTDQFLQLFEDYNLSAYPAQILLYLLAVAVIVLLFWKIKYTDKIVNTLLAILWLWMGIVYHLVFFTSINKAAYLFGILFVGQAVLFIYYGVIKSRLSYRFNLNSAAVTGMVLLLFALVIYPLLSFLFGHIYPSSPTFGLPCPTTIFTFGVLLFSYKKVARVILLIPFLWSLTGFAAAISLGMQEDVSLLVAAVAATAILLYKNNRPGFQRSY